MSERPRLIVFDHCAVMSGAEIVLLRNLAFLCSTFDVLVVLGEDGPLVQSLRAVPVTVVVVPLSPEIANLRRTDALSIRGLKAATAAVCYARSMATIADEWRADLIYTNSLKSSFMWLAVRSYIRTPWLWHLHESVANDYFPAPIVHLIRQATSRGPELVVVNSQASARRLRCSRAVAVIPSPLSPELVRMPPSRPTGDRAFTFGNLGRLAPIKGQDMFLEAFAAAFGPDTSVRAALVGAPTFGETRFERDLKVLVDRLGLQGRVEFRGFRQDIVSELARIDVLVQSSRFDEPFAQVVIEGMAAAVPTLVPDRGGAASLVRNGVTGFVYRHVDTRDLAVKMRMVRDFRDLSVIGQAAREEAVALHSPAVVGTALRDACLRALNQL